MRRVQLIVGLGVIASAAVFLSYNGVILWNSAYALNSRFPELAGYAAVGTMVVECLGLAVAGYLWAHRARLMAIGITVFTIAAAIYTLRLEMNFQIAGQADILEQRAANVGDNLLLQEELRKQYAIRDKMLKVDGELDKDEMVHLAQTRERITHLEQRWDARIVTANPSPEAKWLARQIGGDEAQWVDMLAGMPLLFWALGRLLALPCGILLIGLAMEPAGAVAAPRIREKDAIDEAGGSAGSSGDDPVPMERYRRAINTRPAGGAIRMGLERRLGATINPKSEADGQNVRDFFDECVQEERRDPDRRAKFTMRVDEAHAAYQKWCRRNDISAVGRDAFVAIVAVELGISTKLSRGKPYYSGFRLRESVGSRDVVGRMLEVAAPAQRCVIQGRA